MGSSSSSYLFWSIRTKSAASLSEVRTAKSKLASFMSFLVCSTSVTVKGLQINECSNLLLLAQLVAKEGLVKFDVRLCRVQLRRVSAVDEDSDAEFLDACLRFDAGVVRSSVHEHDRQLFGKNSNLRHFLL